MFVFEQESVCSAGGDACAVRAQEKSPLRAREQREFAVRDVALGRVYRRYVLF